MTPDCYICKKCGKKINESAKFCDNCGAKQIKKNKPSRKNDGLSKIMITISISSFILAVIGLAFGIIEFVELNNLKDSVAVENIHEDGEWYYYFELEMANSGDGWPESYIMNRRSENMYSSFSQCRQAFINDYPDAVGGCAKNCEIKPWSAYALRLNTCEDIVGL